MSLPGRPPARSFLAFDFGTRRVGVASGNTVIGHATPLRTLAAEGDARFQAIAALVASILALLTRMRDLNAELVRKLASTSRKRPPSETMRRRSVVIAMMLVAVGHLPEQFTVAQSPRRPLAEVLHTLG